jgi:hypothetical protein
MMLIHKDIIIVTTLFRIMRLATDFVYINFLILVVDLAMKNQLLKKNK